MQGFNPDLDKCWENPERPLPCGPPGRAGPGVSGSPAGDRQATPSRSYWLPPGGQKLDCSRVTRRGHAPSSCVRAGGPAPESHVGAQEAGPAPRPLPRRENPGERALAAGGDRGGEGSGGLGFDGGGGTGGRGSPPGSKFPPGEDEGGVRRAKWGARGSGPPAFLLFDPGAPGPNPLLSGV